MVPALPASGQAEHSTEVVVLVELLVLRTVGPDSTWYAEVHGD